jgi:hypothetical protein
MKLRYTIRDMLLLALSVALAIGWLLDHRREEEVIKLQAAVEERQHAQIGEAQDWVKRTGTALANQLNEIRKVQQAVEKLTKEIHSSASPSDQQTTIPEPQ